MLHWASIQIVLMLLQNVFVIKQKLQPTNTYMNNNVFKKNPDLIWMQIC